MNAEVEMNHIPFSVAEPDLDVFEAAGRRATVGRCAMNVRLAGQRLATLGILRAELCGDQAERIGNLVQLVEGLVEFLDCPRQLGDLLPTDAIAHGGRGP